MGPRDARPHLLSRRVSVGDVVGRSRQRLLPGRGRAIGLVDGRTRAHGLPSLPRATVTDHEGQQVAFIGPSNAIDLMGAPQRIVRGRSPPVWIPMDFLRFL